MKTIKILACAAVMSAMMMSCGGNRSNEASTDAAADSIAEAATNPVELATGDTLDITAPLDMPVVVDFSASWCGPCRQLHPTFEKLAKKYQGKVKFIYIDIDKVPRVATEYGVEAVPTLLFVNTSGEVKRNIGFMEEASLEAEIQAIMPAEVAPAN
jgi:thioredoxin 1